MYNDQDNVAVSVYEIPGGFSTTPQQTFHYGAFNPTHECFVCGDKIELTEQVCSRFCMKALEQMDLMDSLEAQVPTHASFAANTSDYHSDPPRIVPEQRSVPVLQDQELTGQPQEGPF